MDIRELVSRIDEKLAALELSAADASMRATGSKDTIRNWRRAAQQGTKTSPTFRTLEKIAEVLGTDVSWLLNETPENFKQPEVLPIANAVIGEKLTYTEQEKIPLYGHAVGGLDGEFVLNGNKLDDITAPPSLLGIHGAYAVTVSGDSMEPRYEDGETLFLDPRKRVTRGDYVVAQIQFEEEGPILAYIKKFVRHNSKELVLEQFSPVKQLTFPHENVVSVDYVVMGGRLF